MGYLIRQNKFGQDYLSDKMLITSKDLGHFCPTNNFAYFEISKPDYISIFWDSGYVFSREKIKKFYFIFQSQCQKVFIYLFM